MEDENPTDLSAPEARDVIREIAADTNNIVVISHARKRAHERLVTRRQIELCVQRGEIEEGPFLNDHGNWQVTLRRHAAGEELKCVVAIDWPSKAIVITTYR